MSIGGSNPARAVQPAIGWACALVFAVLAPAFWWAAEPSSTKPDAPLDRGFKDGVNPYSKLSDEQLDSLARSFEDLDRDQRRWLLTEVRKRMSAKGDPPRLQVGKDNRFGRVARKGGRTEQDSPDLLNPRGARPADEESIATKETAEPTRVYGTGVRSAADETADGPVAGMPPQDPPHRNE